MANITVSVSHNFDASANLALNNGETITINTGAVLTMNSDNRWSQNAAVPLNITIDAASGGELLMDGRDVWWLPYTSGSGTVPVLGTTFPASNVTSATASGEFLGVFTGLGVAPSSGTMPATGFIKLRTRTDDFANAQALTLPGGATATASGAGQRGWLNIVGAETGTITIPRLGKWTARGDWFDLATTTGSRNQTIQYFVADVCPALWIETSAGSGVYEIWLNAGDRWSATYVSMDERGKFFGCTAAGVITLAATGFGKLPAAGCKIRVPNIHISSTTSANYAANTLNATLGSRWETVTTAAGEIDLEMIAGSGFYLNASTPYRVALTDVAFLHQIKINAPAKPLVWFGVAVGLASTVLAQALTIDGASGVIASSTFTKYTGDLFNNTAVIGGTAPNQGLTFDQCLISTFGGSGALALAIYSGSTDVAVIASTLLGSRIRVYPGVSNTLISNLQFSDTTTGSFSINGSRVIIYVGEAFGTVIDDVSMMTDGTVPDINLIEDFGVGTKIRNIGTYVTPMDFGSATNYPLKLSGSGTVVQRVFGTKPQTSLITDAQATDVTFENVHSDDTDTLAFIARSHVTVKGCRMAASGFGAIPTTLTGAAATHFYDVYASDTAGLIGVAFSEPSSVTAAYAALTGGAGLFNGAGSALLRSVDDQLTYTWPHFILGYTGLENVAPALSGTNTGNLTIEYDLDKGSGFSGTWQTCDATNLSAEIGISATTGFKPKFRFTCATASISNSINGFYITGTTDATSQQTQYPLDVSTLTLTGLPVAAEVRCYTGAKDGSAVEIGGVEATGGTTFTFTHSSGGSSGFIHIIHPSYKIKEIDYTYAVADTELLIQMDPDPWYSNPV